ncbi:UDP-N-acetylmuramoyl-tripeptide--D-alanyl-D-alanine ligase [Sporosarcina sp. NCCP-2222]|uniref:Mur ligase family protein n=1 Tax=Sporosarcina sp. NCCP-2222 TaxID=2935073 RepID=UPI00208126A0|nr:UDP-N-acetylmuramoyl-tripeptide--D-alanyl-D-alanine ligase [Sporosarcina sp. NCCP-2222]GKV57544.1 UDP-N-acetylmuramoyl-tripeptide--D-alanyl-D-alanine ligase [Sporosarcina sp. NCCP-2222]
MKPLTVGQIRKRLGGELIQGSDQMIVKHGAYRIKQLKHPHTLLFTRKNIVDWEKLKDYFPLVLVTDSEEGNNTHLTDLTIIRVADANDAYWSFVDYYRSLLDLPVIAITGTSGKTTTKEMIRHLLSAQKKIASTNSSNNSRTAHLHYLLSMDEDTEAAVFETAVGAPGDILNAGRYFKPTIGIITNIGEHHLNYCTTLESYIEAKCELFTVVGDSGTMILNMDDPTIRKLDQNYKGKILTVGINGNFDYTAKDVQYADGGMQFNVECNGQRLPMFVPGYGFHQVSNALAALAAVHQIGMSMHEAADSLKTFSPLNKQLQVQKGIKGSTLIDDTWSLTTTSLQAALKVLNEVGQGKKKIAIIGTITDLGSWGYVIHKNAGEMLAKSGIDVLVTIGKHARIMAQTVAKTRKLNMVMAFNNHIRAIEFVSDLIDEQSVVLIKGDMYSKSVNLVAASLKKN